MLFNRLTPQPADALHGVMARYAADPRPQKIDLGVGVYRDANGQSTVMRAVQAAEEKNIQTQRSKAYLGLAGVTDFLTRMKALAFGEKADDSIAAIQSLGGTGGIRMAIDMASKIKPDLTVFIGTPTWPNHITICEILGLNHVTYDYFDKASQSINMDATVDALKAVTPGDIVVLHGPCHNPTGADLSEAELTTLIDAVVERGGVPLFDMAYYGLGNDIADDLATINRLLARTPEAFVIMSCSKAFGLYRERTGILFVKTASREQATMAMGLMERIGRATYSMTPAHGAQAVATILGDTALTQDWALELVEMRRRIEGVRRELATLGAGLSVLDHVTAQKGIFSLLPISSAVVDKMSADYGIYMPSSGRINIAGFKTGDAALFVEALKNCLA